MTFDPKQFNGIALAYLGDAVYEVSIGNTYSNAGWCAGSLATTAQGFCFRQGTSGVDCRDADGGFVKCRRTEVFKHGRDAKSYTHAKHTDVVTYRISTGFEALFGYLHLEGRDNRVAELAAWCIQYVEEGKTGHGKTAASTK